MIRSNGGDFLIELRANQRSLRYGVEDSLKTITPVYSYTIGHDLRHDRIETRTYRIYDGLDIIADKEKWSGNMTIVKYMADTVRKPTGEHTAGKQLHVSSMRTHPIPQRLCAQPLVHRECALGTGRQPVAGQNKTKDTIKSLVYSVFSIWKGLRKKKSDKRKGIAELMRHVSMSFTKLLRFLNQK